MATEGVALDEPATGTPDADGAASSSGDFFDNARAVPLLIPRSERREACSHKSKMRNVSLSLLDMACMEWMQVRAKKVTHIRALEVCGRKAALDWEHRHTGNM